MVINLLHDTVPYPIGSPEYKEVVLDAINQQRTRVWLKPLESLPEYARGGCYNTCAVGMAFVEGRTCIAGDGINPLASTFAAKNEVIAQYERNFETNFLPEVGRGCGGYHRPPTEHVYA